MKKPAKATQSIGSRSSCDPRALLPTLHLNILDSLADRFSFYSALGMRMVETCQVGGVAVISGVG